MSVPFMTTSDDGEGDALDPQAGTRYHFLAPWFTRGYVAHLGQSGTNVYSDLIPVTPANLDYATFPADQCSSTITQRYFNNDADPVGGFLTFMPSEDITITEGGTSWRIPRRLSGTETWSAMDSGVSPWAFSMEGSGSIYIRKGLLVVKLLANDNPNITTDSGALPRYHVVEHFLGGREFDIFVPTSSDTLDLYSLMVPGGTVKPFKFDPVNPLGMTDAFAEDLAPALPVRIMSHLSTDYIVVDISALSGLEGHDIDVSGDEIDFAFIQSSVRYPADSDWIQGAWVDSGPMAELLIGSGSGGVPLAMGQYQIWTRLIDDPQQIVAPVGYLTIN